MQGQINFLNLLLLAGVAVATVVTHTRLRRTGRQVAAVIASLVGFGLMIWLILASG